MKPRGSTPRINVYGAAAKLAEKDRRIAELEATLAEVRRWAEATAPFAHARYGQQVIAILEGEQA